jgi:hypothetical protein
VLRLLFGRFRAGSIERWTVPLIADEDLAAEIIRTESESRRRVSDFILHGSNRLDDIAKDQISEFLWDEYTKLYRGGMVSSSVIGAMDRSRTHIRKVVLLGERPTPLEHTASPYHKLLVSLAISLGLVEYYRVQGGTDVRDSLASAATIDAEALGITLKDVIFTSNLRIGAEMSPAVGTQRHSLQNSLFVCRHGYESPLRVLLNFPNSPDLERLQSQQALYGDHDVLNIDQVTFYSRQHNRAHPNHQVGWAQRHSAMADDYFRKRHGLRVQVWSPGASKNEASYRLNASKPLDAALFAETKRLLPRRFIGIGVEFRPALVQANWHGHD